MRVEVTIAPTAEPLTLTQVKLELRIDSAEDNNRVTRLIEAARAYFEEQSGWSLINRTLTAYLRFWPKATNILLPFPPLVSVTTVTSYPLGVATVMNTANYLVDSTSRQGSILLLPGASWPDGKLYPPGVAIEYVAGFGAAGTDVPDDILNALMQLIAFWDDVPEAVYVPGDTKSAGKVDVMPLGAMSVIEHYRKLRER